MKEKSISKNFLFNLIKTFMSLVFPVITFSYASRILGKIGIGRVNFVTAIVSYYILFASLGITNYGIREGARIRDDRDEFSKFVQEIFIINTITTICTYIVFVLMIIFVPEVDDYIDILLVYGLSIGLTALGLEWLYSAVEDYQYIMIRQLVMQGVSLVLLFVLVRDDGDYLFYTAILVLSSVGANVFNLIHARKYINFKRYSKYELKKHLWPIFVLFSYTISVNLYNNLDSIMLGIQSGDEAVGLYSAAVKMNRMIVTLLASLGIVLIPRLSYYLEQKNKEKFRELINKSLHYNMLFSIPATVGMWVLGNEIILLFSGNAFLEAVETLRALVPIIIIIPITTLINSQILIPSKKEKYVVITTLVGAGVNFTLNYILIPHFGPTGAAIASVIGELSVMCMALLLVRKVYNIDGIFKGIWKYIISAIPIVGIAGLVHIMNLNSIFNILLIVSLSIIVYFGCLYILRDVYMKAIFTRLKGRIYFNR